MNARREKNKPAKPQLNQQLENVSLAKKNDKKNELAVVFGKFCLDLAKLTYGGVFLSAIMEVSFDMNKAMTYGAIAIILLLILGMIFVKIGNKQ